MQTFYVQRQAAKEAKHCRTLAALPRSMPWYTKRQLQDLQATDDHSQMAGIKSYQTRISNMHFQLACWYKYGNIHQLTAQIHSRPTYPQSIQSIPLSQGHLTATWTHSCIYYLHMWAWVVHNGSMCPEGCAACNVDIVAEAHLHQHCVVPCFLDSKANGVQREPATMLVLDLPYLVCQPCAALSLTDSYREHFCLYTLATCQHYVQCPHTARHQQQHAGFASACPQDQLLCPLGLPDPC